MCGGKTLKTKSETSPAPEAMKYYKELMGRLEDVGKLQYDPFTGQRVAGFTPYQEQAMQGIAGLQGAGAGTLQEAVRSGMRGAAPITGADIQRYQDPYQQMVLDAMTAKMRQQEAEDISKLQGQSISAGAFGGDRAKLAQAQLMRNQAEERNMRMSELMSKGYSSALAAAQADREAATRGAGMLQSLAGTEFTQPQAQLQALYGAGRSQQELEQQQLNVPYEQYLEARAFPYQQLQYLAGLGTGVGSQMGGKSVTTAPGPSLGSQLLGAGTFISSIPGLGGALGSMGGSALSGMGSALGSMGSGMASALPFVLPFSDERLKENIEDVGTTNDGQTIYKYNYKGDPQTHIGLLAQEVEKTHPEAVGQMAGFKTVNYDLATKNAVNKAEGGGLRQTALFQKGFIPDVDPVKGRGAPDYISPAGQPENNVEDMVNKAMSLAEKMKGPQETTSGWGATITPSYQPTSVSGVSTMANVMPPAITSPSEAFFAMPVYAHGGGINVPRYYNGGGTDEDVLLSADPRLLAAFKSLGPDRKIKYPEPGPIPEPPTKKEIIEALIDPRLAQAYKAYGVGAKKEPIVPMSTTSPPILTTEAVKEQTLPEITAKEQMLPEITVPTQDVMEVGIQDALNEKQKAPSAGINQSYGEGEQSAAKGKSILGSLLGLSPEAEQATLQAGLAMMAGQSPFALSNIGAGGMAGVKYYNELMKAKQEKELKEKEIAAKGLDLDLVGTDFVTEDDKLIQRSRKTGKLYDEDMNPLPDDVKKRSKSTLIIPKPILDSVGEAGGVVRSLDRLTESFSDEFGGHGTAFWGNVVSTYGQNLVSDPNSPYFKMGQWWQDYNDFANKVRKALFGATLTAGEEAAFNRAYINPGQTPETIKANLNRQIRAARSALYRIMDAQSEQGYSKKTLSKFSGYNLEELKRNLDEFEKSASSVPETTGKTKEEVKTTNEAPSKVVQYYNEHKAENPNIQQFKSGWYDVKPDGTKVKITD